MNGPPLCYCQILPSKFICIFECPPLQTRIPRIQFCCQPQLSPLDLPLSFTPLLDFARPQLRPGGGVFRYALHPGSLPTRTDHPDGDPLVLLSSGDMQVHIANPELEFCTFNSIYFEKRLKRVDLICTKNNAQSHIRKMSPKVKLILKRQTQTQDMHCTHCLR